MALAAVERDETFGDLTMATLLKLMFAPFIIAAMGVVGLMDKGLFPSPLAIFLILLVLLVTGLWFQAYEHKAETEDVRV